MNRSKRHQAQPRRPIDALNEWRSRPGNEARYQAGCARYRASAKGRRTRLKINRRHARKCRLELSDSYVRTQLYLKFPNVPAPGFPDALVAAKREELRLKRKLGISHGAHKTPLKTRIYMRGYMKRYRKNQKNQRNR